MFGVMKVKCQICNRYIEIELTNHHSRIHFDEEERISRILQRNNNIKTIDAFMWFYLKSLPIQTHQ